MHFCKRRAGLQKAAGCLLNQLARFTRVRYLEAGGDRRRRAHILTPIANKEFFNRPRRRPTRGSARAVRHFKSGAQIASVSILLFPRFGFEARLCRSQRSNGSEYRSPTSSADVARLWKLPLPPSSLEPQSNPYHGEITLCPTLLWSSLYELRSNEHSTQSRPTEQCNEMRRFLSHSSQYGVEFVAKREVAIIDKLQFW